MKPHLSVVTAIAVLLIGARGSSSRAAEAVAATVFPGKTWMRCSPLEAGLNAMKLDALRDLVGGRGCVVRHGRLAYSWGDISASRDVASAMKPLLSTLLLLAVQESRIPSVNSPLADFEPRLRSLNAGKDSAITWRQLASQTSGYGLAEKPGAAWAYNDFALALYYDTLTARVFQTNGTAVLHRALARPLQFEDACSFEAFGPKDRPGRLAISMRDFARFGLLWLRGGRWQERQILRPEWVAIALTNMVPPNLPRTRGVPADMLPGQRSIGGTRDITGTGPGFYSFNWWLDGTNAAGQQLFVDAPRDTFLASGHGGKRTCWIIPSLGLVVCWNDSTISDHDDSPGNPATKSNQAARLMREAVNKP